MSSRLTDRIEEGVIGAILAAMTIITFIQVILRYVFNTGLVWALEATIYMFGWMLLFGMSYGIKKGSHIGVDVLVQQLRAEPKRIVGLIACVLSIVYGLIMLIGSYNYVDTMMTLGVEAEDVAIERWILLLPLPVGFALLIYRIAQLGYQILVGKQSGFVLADEAAENIEQFRDLHEETK
jgi:C4-dicarboxylate transporter DctQ subunit